MDLNEYLRSRRLSDPAEAERQKDREAGVRLANNLGRFRRDMNLSQTDLADLMGTSQARIAGYESGRANPTLRTLVRLSQALEVSIGDMVDMKPPSIRVIQGDLPMEWTSASRPEREVAIASLRGSTWVDAWRNRNEAERRPVSRPFELETLLGESERGAA